jgi:muscarinic acetylcholine receptor M3
MPDESGNVFTFGQVWKIFFIVISCGMCIVTTLGNMLVLKSFQSNKKLRTITNYFLISLACADLMIGIVSIPIASVYFITDKWLPGPLVCDLWLSLDYTLSNASVANLLLISLDRYFSLTRPIVYRASRTGRKVRVTIAFSWIMSAVLWTPFILFFNSKKPMRNESTECRVEFLYTNQYITLITAFAAFYVPVTIICIIYFKIWRLTKERHGNFLKHLQLPPGMKNPRAFIFPFKRKNILRLNENKSQNTLKSNSDTMDKQLSDQAATAVIKEVWNLKKAVDDDRSTMSNQSNGKRTSSSTTNHESCNAIPATGKSPKNCLHQFEIESSYYSILFNYLNENFDGGRQGGSGRRKRILRSAESEAQMPASVCLGNFREGGEDAGELQNGQLANNRRVYHFRSRKSQSLADGMILKDLNIIRNKQLEHRCRFFFYLLIIIDAFSLL